MEPQLSFSDWSHSQAFRMEPQPSNGRLRRLSLFFTLKTSYLLKHSIWPFEVWSCAHFYIINLNILHPFRRLSQIIKNKIVFTSPAGAELKRLISPLQLRKPIPYNFTKFLVSKEGKVVYYSPLVDPVFLASEIDVYLNLQSWCFIYYLHLYN